MPKTTKKGGAKMSVTPSHYERDIRTPWGWSHSVDEIATGVRYVTTGSHGGYMISRALAKRHLSPAALQIGRQWGGYYAFEEDCAYAVIWYEQPAWLDHFQRTRLTPGQARAEAYPILLHWYPKYFGEEELRQAVEQQELGV